MNRVVSQGYARYRCMTRTYAPDKCQCPSIKEEYLEELILQTLQSLIARLVDVKAVIDAARQFKTINGAKNEYMLALNKAKREQERLQDAHVQLMGAVQLEIIEQLMHDRFGLDIAFGPGSILYAETITAPGEGVGHFEPLRHYAEVHVLIEPLERGSGLEFATDVSEDELDRNWQRLIMQHLQETEHPGVLIGAPITDMRLTLIGGRGHLKHTEGGDFRQATYRAVRQGLMEAREAGHAVLLEPWYRFRLELPQEMLGRALSDVQRMGGESAAPQIEDGLAVVEGAAPVSEMRDYAMDVNAYTHGEGRLALMFGGYRECHDEQTVVDGAGYDPEADLEHTPDSVFCAHGAGYTVKWYKVPEFCHVPMRRGVGINRLEQ